ncbi:hypothetical protein BWQ96_01932 [Gracilariopsis chorda]|uniref:Thioredoxin domain-containing protein n=1 Tax=Gracilariopsis chorda TaxID=448386 RepID=A0A2V3J1P5_9FLOR|nr:hypothetical protein BWQ96_01932 [Gracilariopsis chorda]|eukprot:PXF48243.1 hypothetical protein BWQ96_01932 [Gracilariopsis chorda]
MQRFAAAARIAIIVSVASFFALANARLTHNGFNHGHTVAPKGTDFILFSNASTKHASKEKAHPPYITPSSDSPFFTLHHEGCIHARPQALLTDEGFVGILNTVSAANLSKLSSLSDHVTLVLFHGGPSCKYSRAILPTWVNLTRYMRASCLLALDAATDSMMNYNLMVLGFPTLMRVSPESGPNYHGDRSLSDLIAWAVKSGGIAPMDVESIDDLLGDLHRYNLKFNQVVDGSIDVLDIRESKLASPPVNWTLIGANFVTVIYFAFQLNRAHRAFASFWKRNARQEREGLE